MIKKMLLTGIALLSAVCTLCGAADIEVVKDGKSDYQIVVPENGKDKNIDGFINVSAKLLQNCIIEAAGVSLPIVKESQYDKTQPAVFIGNTIFAKANGIDTEKMENWTYVNKTVGKNIILICESASCLVLGFENIYYHISKKLGIRFGETTGDNLFTILPVTCLGNCDHAPTIMINDETFNDLTIGKIDELLDKFSGK